MLEHWELCWRLPAMSRLWDCEVKCDHIIHIDREENSADLIGLLLAKAAAALLPSSLDYSPEVEVKSHSSQALLLLDMTRVSEHTSDHARCS